MAYRDILTHSEADRHTAQIHYLNRRDLERRLELQERISAHLARLSIYLAARLGEVRDGR